MSSPAKRACSDKSRHTTLTLQGPRGQWSARSSQTPSLCHAAPIRQRRIAVATGMKPTVRIRTDKTRLRSHLIRDGIHDKGLNLETSLADEEPRHQ